MNLIIRSAIKTMPTALGGRPKNHAIKAVVIDAMILHVIALPKCLFFVTTSATRFFYLLQPSYRTPQVTQDISSPRSQQEP